MTGRAAEAERWADVVDRSQYGGGDPPDGNVAKPAALLRAMLSPIRGRADAE